MADYIPNQSLGGMFAQSLGTGLGEGLKALTEHKLGEVMKQKELNQGAQFWKSLGLDDQTAYAFASTPKEVQKSLLDRLEGASIGQPQQAQQPSAMGQQGQIGQQQLAQAISKPGQVGQPQQADQLQQPVQAQPGQITLGANPLERRHRETLAQQKEIAQQKISKEVRHKIVEDKKVARQELHDLNRMEELNEGGKLDTPGYTSFLERSGLDISALRSPDSEEFQKIEAGFLKNIGSYFKGSISNNEITQFLKTVPNLSQSPEGRKRVIAMLKIPARAKLEYATALKEVLAKNKGIPPFDLEEQIEDIVDTRMDKLAEQFKRDLAKPVPKSQPQFVTALQSAAGSAAKPVGGALLGAGIGSIFPGVGTALGAGLGALGGVGLGALSKITK